MNKLYISIFWLLALAFFSCTKEPALKPDASFSIENIDDLEAGKAIKFTLSGEADFFTLYPGTASSNYDSIPLHKGVVIRSKTFTFTYAKQGNYKPTIVASSYGDWAEEELVDVKSLEITVSDKRNEMTRFYFKDLGIDGVFEDDIISFSVSDANNVTNLAASWILLSEDAKVYVGDVEQTMGVTKNNFANPVTYRIVAPSGEEKLYTVQVTLFPASGENQLLSFGIVNPDRLADIDEENKEVRLTVPFGTRLTSINVYGTSSPGSKMKIGPRSVIATPFPNNLSAQPTILKITAENKDVADYKIYTTSENAFQSFSFSNIVPNPSAAIDHTAKTIQLSVAPEVDLTKLIAVFTGNDAAKTTVNGVTQVSGVTENDFTSPVSYIVTGQDGVPSTYIVTVDKYN